MQVIGRSLVVAAALALGSIPERSSAQPPPGSTVLATPQRTSTAIDRRRITSILGASDTSLRVVRPSGTATVPQATDSVRIRPGEFIFRKTAEAPRRISRASIAAGAVDSRGIAEPGVTPGVPEPAPVENPTVSAPAPSGGTAYALPYRWMSVDSAGVEHVLVPFLIVEGGGLSYNAASRTYRGSATFGVVDTLHQGSPPMRFAEPLRMQLTTTTGGRVSPIRLALAGTGTEESVSIDAPGATAVRVRLSTDATGVVIPIPILKMTVSLRPLQSSIEGFGLATTEIRLSLPSEFGRNDTASVTLETTSAPVSPGEIDVIGTHISKVHVRSGMPGPDTIRAYVSNELVGETVVTFKPPWVFISALLVGLVLGAFARLMGGKRWRNLGNVGREFAKGAPFGIIAAIGAALGIDWFNLKLDDGGAWIAVVFLTTLGSWLGAALLDRIIPPKA